MKKMIISLAVILLAAGVLAGGATSAFFTDTETSTNNTFTAGALDLKVDNDSYYNGNRCTLVDLTDDQIDNGTWMWQGSNGYPVPGTPCETSFPAVDLDDGFVFFKFNDVKPDDEGEDTISLHVQNDAWACMDLTVTSNDDNSTTEPEGLVDDVEDASNPWDGELAQNLYFFWWADDGDNVYEEGEAEVSEGIQSLLDLAPQGGSFSVPLADGGHNVWNPNDPTPGPLPGGETVYIAKAWCMGDLSLNPLPQDNDGTDGPLAPGRLGGGFSCDGSQLGNNTQTDGVELNLMFRAVQARHNPNFLCRPTEQETATLTVNKIITADTEGIGVEDFELHIDLAGPDGDLIVPDNIPATGLTPGNYNVYEVILPAGLPPGVTFTTTFGGACDASGNVVLNPGDNLVCTITNVENVPVSFFFDGFGVGSTDTTFDEAPVWEEGGVGGATKRQSDVSGNNTASPNSGSRMAAMAASSGYICRNINAAGQTSLKLDYEWRGDTDAEAGDNGVVEYATGGTCAAPTGLTTLATHPLTTTTWQTNTLSLPVLLENTNFFLRFRNAANTGGEDFRVDGVNVRGL